MKINMADLKKLFGKKAKVYANDKDKTKKLINDAVIKAEELDKSGPVGEFYHRLQLLFGLIKDWLSGSYKDVPKGSVVIIIIGLLYFLNPFDLIPDIIPVIGYVDDAFVLGLVIKQVNSEIEKYKNWKLNNYKVNIDEI